MRRRLLVGLVVVAVAICAVGCASIDRSSGETPTASPTASPSVTTPTPVPTRPALTDLVIGPDGIGDLVVGAPVPQAADDVALVRFDSTYCKGVADARGVTFDPSEPWSGAWVPTIPGDPFQVLTADGLQGGDIFAVSVGFGTATSPVSTASGINTLTSTRADLLKAYPKFDQIIRSTLSDVYVIDGTHSHLDIEVSNELDRVAFLIATATPPRAIYGTDALAACAL